MTQVYCTVVSMNGKSCKLVITMQFPVFEFQKSLSPNNPPAHMLLPEGEGLEANNQLSVAQWSVICAKFTSTIFKRVNFPED